MMETVRHWRLLWVVCRMTLMVYAGLTAYLYFSQRRMIYYPVKAPLPEMVLRGARLGWQPWLNAEGELIGWMPEGTPGPSDDVVLVFHGNAGSALDRQYFADGFSGIEGGPSFTVYLCEYPGYGSRSGRPSETSFSEAADEAFRLLRQLAPDGRIFVAGESLGSGVAAGLAGRTPDEVSGLLLVTAFSSMADVAHSYYPYLPVRWLLRDRYDNIKALNGYRGPVAILLARQDEVVPTRFGQRLYDAYEGPKRLWLQDSRHNSLDYRPGLSWWREVGAFLTSGH